MGTSPSKKSPPRASADASTTTSHEAVAKTTYDSTVAMQQVRLTEAEGKKKALAAVKEAKRDLLKHSLEMMVKQKLTTAEGATR